VGYQARIEKLQIVFSEKRSRKIKTLQRTPITAIACARSRGSSSRDLHFINNSNKLRLRPRKYQELIWNRPAVHLFRSDHFINVDCANLELYRMR
jgi:hypothetical protein